MDGLFQLIIFVRVVLAQDLSLYPVFNVVACRYTAGQPRVMLLAG